MTEEGRTIRDDRLASDIEALLAIDVSPDFRVRVRTALGTGALEVPWWRRPLPATSALAACAVLMIVAMWGWNLAREGTWRALPAPDATARASATPSPRRQIDAPAAAHPDMTHQGHASAVVARATPRARASRGESEARPAMLVLPDVVLAEDEVLGLQLLLIPPVTPVETETDAEPPVRLADIEVREILLEPLAVVARLEGELE